VIEICEDYMGNWSSEKYGLDEFMEKLEEEKLSKEE